MKGDAEFAKGMSLPLASVEKESAYYQAASWYRLALTVLDVGETAVECYDRNIAPLTDKEAYAEASNRG
jgi:cellobiose phosphorylase